MSNNITKDFPNFNDAKNAIERIKEKGFPDYDNFKNHNEYIKVVSNLIQKNLETYQTCSQFFQERILRWIFFVLDL
jgi:hypothetical protein